MKLTYPWLWKANRRVRGNIRYAQAKRGFATLTLRGYSTVIASFMVRIVSGVGSKIGGNTQQAMDLQRDLNPPQAAYY
jgi:hypothetical protein